jgi:hypothetical protein
MTCVIHLLPDRLTAFGHAPRRRWWHPQPARVEGDSARFDDAGALAEALQSVLTGTESFGRDVDFIVSDAWCHYQLIPRPEGIFARRQLDALNRIRFQAVLGDEAEALRLVAYRPPRASADLVAGLPKSLIDTLRTGTARAGKRALSIRPYWVACARATPVRSSGIHWLLADDGASRTLGLFRGRQCLGVRSTRQRREDDSLAVLLAREIPRYEEATLATNVHAWGCHVLAQGALPTQDFEAIHHGELTLLSAVPPGAAV